MQEDPHGIGNSEGIQLNFIEEIADTSFIIEFFKFISGFMGKIHGNKKYGKEHLFQFITMSIGVTNKLPKGLINEQAMINRLRLVVDFINVFSGKKDINISSIPKEEFSGLLFYLLTKVLPELYKRNFKFTNEMSDEEVISKFEIGSNPLSRFIEESCEIGENLVIQPKYFNQAYQDWCEVNNLEIIRDKIIKKHMQWLKYPIELKIDITGGIRTSVFTGLTLKLHFQERKFSSIEDFAQN